MNVNSGLEYLGVDRSLDAQGLSKAGTTVKAANAVGALAGLGLGVYYWKKHRVWGAILGSMGGGLAGTILGLIIGVTAFSKKKEQGK